MCGEDECPGSPCIHETSGTSLVMRDLLPRTRDLHLWPAGGGGKRGGGGRACSMAIGF